MTIPHSTAPPLTIFWREASNKPPTQHRPPSSGGWSLSPKHKRARITWGGRYRGPRPRQPHLTSTAASYLAMQRPFWARLGFVVFGIHTDIQQRVLCRHHCWGSQQHEQHLPCSHLHSHPVQVRGGQSCAGQGQCRKGSATSSSSWCAAQASCSWGQTSRLPAAHSTKDTSAAPPGTAGRSATSSTKDCFVLNLKHSTKHPDQKEDAIWDPLTSLSHTVSEQSFQILSVY